MKKKVISALLCATVAASMLAGCGSTASTDTAAPAADAAPAATEAAAPAEDTTADAGEEAAAPAAGDEGSVLNIYVWNEEFANRVIDHYPGYEASDPSNPTADGKIGDVTVKWHLTANEGSAYQDNLDTNLLKQADAAADDKIDIFLVEADYALKYVDTEYTMPIADLGITDDELADQYKYTQDVMTDSNGVLKGLSWQGCPGVLIYNREAANDVFGTDDPAEIQNYVKDWDTFTETAATLKDGGYNIVSTVNDAYRVYSNNVSGKWVQDGKVVIDPSIEKWVEDSKALVDAGETTTNELWSDPWNLGFYPDGKVFCYFGPAWLINFSMHADDAESIAANGGWAATEGPQGFFWGGTWICAATGTDNPTLVADIMRQLTTNKDIMLDIVKQDSDFVNNKPAMEEAATDDSFAFDVLGGQNPLAMFCAGAEKIDLSNQSAYDQGCNEEFQKAMKNYFDGNATYEEALEQFYTAIGEKYPDVDTSH